MRRVTLSRRARRDLGDIYSYLLEVGADRVVARAFIDTLERQCERLGSLPGTLGTARFDLELGLRSFAMRGYLIFFRYAPGTLRVVRVMEGHRDMPRHVGVTREGE